MMKKEFTRQPGKKKSKETPLDYRQIFSAETLQARVEWNDIFKILRDKNHQIGTTQQSYPLDMREK